MKLFSPTITINESSIRGPLAFPGFLLGAAVGGSLLAAMAIRKRYRKAALRSEQPRTLENRLREIDDLRDRSLITAAEQAKARARILNE
ncbi:MAG: hypothetical protein ACJAVK_002734 [Akkermansiaceae bacterium]|jgi:hypothetical protein